MRPTTTAKPEDADRCASIWFLKLETAIEREDYALAAYANDRLKRMGLTVFFDKPPSATAEGGAK